MIGGLRLDLAARTCSLDGLEIRLTRKEFDLWFFWGAMSGAW